MVQDAVCHRGARITSRSRSDSLAIPRQKQHKRCLEIKKKNEGEKRERKKERRDNDGVVAFYRRSFVVFTTRPPCAPIRRLLQHANKLNLYLAAKQQSHPKNSCVQVRRSFSVCSSNYYTWRAHELTCGVVSTQYSSHESIISQVLLAPSHCYIYLTWKLLEALFESRGSSRIRRRAVDSLVPFCYLAFLFTHHSRFFFPSRLVEIENRMNVRCNVIDITDPYRTNRSYESGYLIVLSNIVIISNQVSRKEREGERERGGRKKEKRRNSAIWRQPGIWTPLKRQIMRDNSCSSLQCTVIVDLEFRNGTRTERARREIGYLIRREVAAFLWKLIPQSCSPRDNNLMSIDNSVISSAPGSAVFVAPAYTDKWYRRTTMSKHNFVS